MGTQTTNRGIKSAREGASRRFLDISRSDPTFLDRIITTDETWLHYYEPEDKRMSMVWKNRDIPPPKKANVVKLMEKVMCVVFMDSSSVILVHRTARHMVKEAFARKTILRSRDDQIRYSNLNTVWLKEVYEKWMKRLQKCINYASEYFEKE